MYEIYKKYQVVDVSTVTEFLTKYYKADRFTDRNEITPGYSDLLITSSEEQLKEKGYCIISHFDSVTGEAVSFYGKVSEEENNEESSTTAYNNYQATYSPQDNKLRLYADSRLDPETYARARKHGFIYAPKQGFFVSPMWRPEREDFLIELAGSIEDECSTAEERAAERAERFEGYSEKREAEAERTAEAVRSLTDSIPLGQPILIGHHSERKARKNAERIENGMRKAVNLWETSQYWERRAKAALQHAKFKERPDVRFRRLKGLEASHRKQTKYKIGAEKALKLWTAENLTMKDALTIANYQSSLFEVHTSFKFPLDRYPRTENTYEGDRSLYSALDEGIIDEKQAVGLMVPGLNRMKKYAERWLNHLENRMNYERAMLDGYHEVAGTVPAQKLDIQKGGIVTSSSYLHKGRKYTVLRVNKKDGIIKSVSVPGEYGTYQIGIEMITSYTAPTAEAQEAVKKKNALPPLVNCPGEKVKNITKAEYSALDKDNKRTYRAKATTGNGEYRYRVAYLEIGLGYQKIYITDQKTVPLPAPEQAQDFSSIATQPIEVSKEDLVHMAAQEQPQQEAKPSDYETMKEQLKVGVQVAVSEQLYPTPLEIVEQMIDYAEIESEHSILEPSAGTGNILKALEESGANMGKVKAVELNWNLVELLRGKYPNVSQGDFLEYSPETGFDRILMNPPFKNGCDIDHIKHAYSMLNPGGVLVTICANGPRQNAKLKPLAENSGGEWLPLPSGSFNGTGVNTALAVFRHE